MTDPSSTDPEALIRVVTEDLKKKTRGDRDHDLNRASLAVNFLGQALEAIDSMTPSPAGDPGEVESWRQPDTPPAATAMDVLPPDVRGPFVAAQVAAYRYLENFWSR